MAQSNDSNVRGIPPFWPNHTLEPPHAWTQWSDQFQLAIIAKDNLDIESLHGPEIPETQIPILEQATGSESDAEKANRESRNKSTMKQYESAEEKRINEEKRKFNGMRRTEADKKLRSILFLALAKKLQGTLVPLFFASCFFEYFFSSQMSQNAMSEIIFEIKYTSRSIRTPKMCRVYKPAESLRHMNEICIIFLTVT